MQSTLGSTIDALTATTPISVIGQESARNATVKQILATGRWHFWESNWFVRSANDGGTSSYV